MYDPSNSKVLGKFKDEANGKIITHFVGLKPKMYSFKTHEEDAVKLEKEDNETKVAKGCPKGIIKKEVRFDDYRDSLFWGLKTRVNFSCLRSQKQQVYTIGIDKVGLTRYENKRYYLNDIESLAYGHKTIPKV